MKMLRNLQRTARRKTEEIRPKKRRIGKFGTETFGVRKSTVDKYGV